MSAAAQIIFNVVPLGFSRDEAIAYTHLSDKMFDHLEQGGSLTPQRIGNRGAKIYYREQLDSVMQRLFAGSIANVDREFDFDAD